MRASLLVACASGLLSGCVYFNTIYNAKELYRETELARLAGQDTGLAEWYDEVIEKATRAYSEDEHGKWSDDALLLIGQAQLRRGALRDAGEALESVLAVSEDPVVRRQATLYLGAVDVASGRPAMGAPLLDEALITVTDPLIKAEGHLWRARALLQQGYVDQGWWDLDRVAEAHRTHVAPAGLERLVWGIALGDSARTLGGVQTLIFTSNARVYGDSIRQLLQRAAERWSPAVSADVMVNAERARWSRTERDRLLMTRARFAFEAGDTVQALADVRRVGGGVGEQAFDARVTLAKWRLSDADRVQGFDQVRPVLLPAVAAVEAQALLNGMRRVELLMDYGRAGDLIAYFAAAEIARDVLDAPRIAVALFAAYAAERWDSPWSGKALLAARALAVGPAARERFDDRLGALPGNAYVRYARQGDEGPDLADLEGRLQSVLDEILARADEEMVARRVLVGGPGG